MTTPVTDAAAVPTPGRGHALLALRRGSGVDIQINLREWRPIPQVEPGVRNELRRLVTAGSPPPGGRVDEVLLHELVHALMILRGASSLNRVRGFDIVDDIFAVLITNIYAVELGRVPRRDHSHFRAMGRTGSDLRQDPRLRGHILDFERLLPDIASGLRSIGNDANPFTP